MDQMYITFDRARYCVRRLNATHEIGCQASLRGNSGRMYMIDNNNEFNSYLADSKTIDSSSSFIITLNIDLFDSEHMDRLMTRLDTKLNGLLVYLKSNLTRPEDFSHDDKCPNHRESYYLNQTEIVNWNPKGTGLFFRSFPFPIMLIDEEDDYKLLLDYYKRFDHTQSTPSCGLELKAFQNAAHTSKTCIRRNDISHSLIDTEEALCDPIGGLNIYSKLSDPLTITPKQRQEKSVILILATTDSFQMFLKTKGSTGGAQQPATSLITFLSLAHLIGQAQEDLNKLDKEIIFVTLDGEALDYSASFRFLFDMEHGYFPNEDKTEERIKKEHIHSIIEFHSLSFINNPTSVSNLYAHPSNLINQTFIDKLLNKTSKIHQMPVNALLPPASSQIFLRQTSSSSFPVYILTSTNQSQLSNHYYHSFFDDPSTLSINISSLEYNTTTDFSQWIKSIVEPLGQTLIETFTGLNNNLTIEQEIINNLVYCVLKNINCPLIHNVSNETTGSSFESFNQTSLPFSINTYPTATTPTFPFVRSILSYFLRDRTYDTKNFTETTCKEQGQNDTLRSYRFVDGYLPSISTDKKFSSYCVRSYFRVADSSSPAFSISKYDLSQTTYPAWAESRWSTISLRLFIIPTKTHEAVTLIIEQIYLEYDSTGVNICFRWSAPLSICLILVMLLLICGTIVLALIPVYLTTDDIKHNTKSNKLSYYTIYASNMTNGRSRTLSNMNDLSKQMLRNLPQSNMKLNIDSARFLPIKGSTRTKRQISNSGITCEQAIELDGDLFTTHDIIRLPTICQSENCRQRFLKKNQNDLRTSNHRIGTEMKFNDDDKTHNVQMAFCAFSITDPYDRISNPTDASGCTSETSKYIYLLDQDSHFFRLHPKTFVITFVGTLNCSTTAYPYSMAVQRNGKAWTLFTDGNLYTFDVNTVQCQTTSYVSEQEGLILFGMNFAIDKLTNQEKLYLTSDSSNPPYRLATLDINSLEISIIGYYYDLSARAELTGTNDGRLFGLFEGKPYIIAEINATNGEILSQTAQDMIQYTSDSLNFAFASYASNFFLFVGDNSFTDIFLFDSSTKTTFKQTRISNGIVGSATSTCM
ncbi:hypothetical protein I4U23_030236 [Adineta vaga]|nr:hypothetical protein I4U23_030236 [Adineta vaga]